MVPGRGTGASSVTSDSPHDSEARDGVAPDRDIGRADAAVEGDDPFVEHLAGERLRPAGRTERGELHRPAAYFNSLGGYVLLDPRRRLRRRLHVRHGQTKRAGL